MSVAAAACHDPTLSPAVNSVGTTASSVNAYLQALHDWPSTDPDTQLVGDPKADTTAQDGVVFACTERDIDITQRYEDITAIGLNAGVIWPGALIQGGTLRDGALAGVPVPRSSIRLAIDLATDTASATVDNPTGATVQDAIAALQRRGDPRFTGDSSVLPARISYTRSEAWAYEQAMTAVKVNFHLTTEVAKATLSAAFSADRKLGSHTIIVRFFQPMYTIAFADEALPTPADFLAPSVTVADLEEQAALGTIKADNQPVYVKSVTYGRMLLFTMTSDSSVSVDSLEAALDVSVGLSKDSTCLEKDPSGSSCSVFGTNDSLTTSQRSILRNSSYSMLALGGTEAAALAAVRSGRISDFFEAAPATTAVPLTYRINDLKNRHAAALNETTRFTLRTCTPQTAYLLTIAFLGISDRDTAACPNDTTRVVSQVIDSMRTPSTLSLFDSSFVLDSHRSPTLPRSVVVNRQTASRQSVVVRTTLTKGSVTTATPQTGPGDWNLSPKNQSLMTIIRDRTMMDAQITVSSDANGRISGFGYTVVSTVAAPNGVPCYFTFNGTRTDTTFTAPLALRNGLVAPCLNTTSDAPGEKKIYQFGSMQGTIGDSSRSLTVKLKRTNCADTIPSYPSTDCTEDVVLFERAANNPRQFTTVPQFENRLTTSFGSPFELPGGNDIATFSHTMSIVQLANGTMGGQCTAKTDYSIAKAPVFLAIRNGRKVWLPVISD